MRTVYTPKVSHKKVCGFCNFVQILWKGTKLHMKLESDVTCHKILICVKHIVYNILILIIILYYIIIYIILFM